MSLIYNSIAFSDLKTTTHVYGPVADPSHSDQLYTIFVIGADAVFNPALLPGAGTDATVADTVVRVRHMLTQPRQPIYYDLASPAGVQGVGTPIINLPGGRDDAGGPWPDEKAFTINYTTQGTLEVHWECTVKLRDCGDSVPSQPLSLRWEDSLSWDSTWKAIRRRNGRLIISSLQANNIDWFRRNKLAMPVDNGFKRVSSHYTCSKDGLSCDFAFQDEQIRWAPPVPAVELNIVQSESGPTISNVRKGSVSVTLQGQFNANPRDLFNWALRILYARIWAANPLNSQGQVPGQIVVETRESTQNVEVSAVCTYKTQPNAVRSNINQMTITPGAIWRGILNPIGTLIGGIISAQVTQQGNTPVALSYFPWVGYGTSPDGFGFAPWADPWAAINGPADGLGIAASVKLMAALLSDPCGSAVETTPNAAGDITTIRSQVQLYNTPAYGQGGEPGVNTAQLTASMSPSLAQLAATTNVPLDTAGLSFWDGQPGVYDHWQSLNEYVQDGGNIIIPTCNPTGININVQTSSQMVTLIKRWSAKRDGAPPNIPAPVVLKPSGDIDTNWVFVRGSSPQLRNLDTISDDVSVSYEAKGYYVFQALDASLVSYIADIPPTLQAVPLLAASQWFNDSSLFTGSQGSFGFSASNGTNPLGTNSLPNSVPN